MGVSFKVAKTGKRYRHKYNENGSPTPTPTEPRQIQTEGELAGIGDRVANPSNALAKSECHLVSQEHEVSFSLNLFPNGFSVGKANGLPDDVPKQLLPYDRASESLFCVEKEMDGVEGALKNSFMTHTLDVKVTHDEFLDDFWTGNAETEVVSVDDIFVDNFFDFSDNELAEEPEEKQNQQKEFNNSNYGYGSELYIPMDDLADIEWLSNFVDDSFFGYPLAFPLKKISENPRVSKEPCFMTKFRTKARSKRARTGGRVWSLGSLSFTDSSSCKQKKKEERETIQLRQCTHCQVHKTPQWRTGPLGPKTLCNACGVRFRSGRLLPEYRPACSPTFSSEVHSNNHRKVLEMRKKKKVEI